MSHTRAPRNQIPAVENASHDRFTLRRMAGLLAGWLDQGPPVIPGYAGARRQARSEVITLWMPPHARSMIPRIDEISPFLKPDIISRAIIASGEFPCFPTVWYSREWRSLHEHCHPDI